jgi:hypothetical protein
MDIDLRIEARTMNLGLMGRGLESMRARSEQDGENTQALAGSQRDMGQEDQLLLRAQLVETGELRELRELQKRTEEKFRSLAGAQ